MAVVASISQQIWDMKYRLKGPSGEPLDKTIEDTWRRVAMALAAPEREPAPWTERFYAAMTDFQFLPAGRANVRPFQLDPWGRLVQRDLFPGLPLRVRFPPPPPFLAAPNHPARQERRCAMWQVARWLA